MKSKNDEIPGFFECFKRAVDHPLPELKDTYKAELELLKEYIGRIPDRGKVLDMGCGIARPLDKLSKLFPNITFYGTDLSDNMLIEAKKRTSKLKNVHILEDNALAPIFKNDVFDLTYSSFNTVGSFDFLEQYDFIIQKALLTKPKGKIITTSWRSHDDTLEFLKRYYPKIGMKILNINRDGTQTDKGFFGMIGDGRIMNLYKPARIKYEGKVDLGVWTAYIGEVT
jgi:SAM-dependent methyltransferase